MKRRVPHAIVWGILVPAVVGGSVATGLGWAGSEILAQPGSESESNLKEILYPYYAHAAAQREFFRDVQHAQKLELQKRPVLTWTNVDNYMGSVFVWTYQGRPELIGCIGSPQTCSSL